MKRILVVDDSATVRKVVAQILTRRGYDVLLACDGVEALAALEALSEKDETVDLVLLDLVMPRMDGRTFSRALREHQILAHTPVVLMTAKSARVREQFVEQTGALDAITKPFDADALIAVLENAIYRVETGAAPAPPARVPSVPPLRTTDPDARAPGHVAFDDDVLLYGNLATMAIGAILQLLQLEKQSGVLTIVRGEREVTTVLRDGLIDLVQSRGAGDEFRLGRFFIEEGLVTSDEIDDALSARSTERPMPLGDVLVQSERVTPAQLRAALLRQSSELVYELLRWNDGYFVLERRPAPPLAASAALGLPVASVVLEGVRRVDEWRVMEARVGRFDEALQGDPLALEALGADALSKAERTVLDLVDGERTIREIIALAHMSSFDTCKVLYQLLEARLLRRRTS